MPTDTPTILSDLIEPSVWVPYISQYATDLNAFAASGIRVQTEEFNSLCASPNTEVNMPYFDDLDGDDENIDTGSEVSIDKITTGQDKTIKCQRQRAWGAEDLAGQLAGADPIKEIAKKIGGYWARRDQVSLINTLNGIFAAASMSGLVHAIHQTSGALSSSHYLNAMSTIDACQRLGDHKYGLGAIAMHSAVEAHLRKLNLIDFVAESEQGLRIPVYEGMRVIVDDGMPTSTVDSKTVYTTYIFGNGAVGYGVRNDARPIDAGIGNWYLELARVPRKAQSQIITRREFMQHIRGVKWAGTPAAASGFPTNAELAVGTNWTRVYDVKQIRVVKVTHNILA